MPLDSNQKKRLALLLKQAHFRYKPLSEGYLLLERIYHLYVPNLPQDVKQKYLSFLSSYKKEFDEALKYLEELISLLENPGEKLLKEITTIKEQLQSALNKVNEVVAALSGDQTATSKPVIKAYQNRFLELNNFFAYFDVVAMRKASKQGQTAYDYFVNVLNERFRSEFLKSTGVSKKNDFHPDEEQAAQALYADKVLKPLLDIWTINRPANEGPFLVRRKDIEQVFAKTSVKDTPAKTQMIKEFLEDGKDKEDSAQSAQDRMVKIAERYAILNNPWFHKILMRAQDAKETGVKARIAAAKPLIENYLRAEADRIFHRAELRLKEYSQAPEQLSAGFAGSASAIFRLFHKLEQETIEASFAELKLDDLRDAVKQYVDLINKRPEARQIDLLVKPEDLSPELLIKKIYEFFLALAKEQELKGSVCPAALNGHSTIKAYADKIIELHNWCKGKAEGLHGVKLEIDGNSFYAAVVVALFIKAIVAEASDKLEARGCLTRLGLFSSVPSDLDIRNVLAQKNWQQKYTSLLRKKTVDRLRDKANQLQDSSERKKAVSQCDQQLIDGVHPDEKARALVRELIKPKELGFRSERDYQDPSHVESDGASFVKLAHESAGFSQSNQDQYRPLVTRASFEKFVAKFPGQLTLRESLSLADTLSAKVKKLREEKKPIDGYFYLELSPQNYVRIDVAFDPNGAPSYSAEKSANGDIAELIEIKDEASFQAALKEAKKIQDKQDKKVVKAASFKDFQIEAQCVLLDEVLPLGNQPVVSRPLEVSKNSAAVFSNRDLASLRQALTISNTDLWDINRQGEGETAQVKITYADVEVTVKLISPIKTNKNPEEKPAIRAESSTAAKSPEELEKHYACLARAFFEAVKDEADLESDVPYRIYLGHSENEALVKKVLQHLVDAGFNAVICGNVEVRRPEIDMTGGPASIALRGGSRPL